MRELDELFTQWREAERIAHDFEQRVAWASVHAVEGHGAAPAADDYEMAHALRQEARKLFRLTMDRVEVKADAARHRHSRH